MDTIQDRLKRAYADASQCNDPYALQHEQLRRQILAEATADEASLEDAGIEISEGWLLEQYPHTNDCAAYLDDFEFMRELNANGELDSPLYGSVVVELARHDVFLALARYENDLAEFLFSSKAASAGWTHDKALLFGLRAALAANKAYEFALRLKANHAK